MIADIQIHTNYNKHVYFIYYSVPVLRSVPEIATYSHNTPGQKSFPKDLPLAGHKYVERF